MGADSLPVVLLVLYGRVDISVNGAERVSAGAGTVVLLPADCYYVLTAREEAHLLAYAVEELLEMWEGEPLSGEVPSEGGIVGRLSVLEMNERLWEYALTVSEYLFDGISSPRFMRMKAFEFMHLLQFYYARDELAAFFSPLLDEDMDFTRIVMDNWSRVRSKAELAAIAGLSTSRFGGEVQGGIRHVALSVDDVAQERADIPQTGVWQRIAEGDKRRIPVRFRTAFQ